jgi:serine/threonine protein kinase
MDKLLGRGGMGEVYRAFDTEHHRTVAVKRLAPHLADDPEFQLRFGREARLAAGLRSPHVIPIHRYGEIHDQLYIDMRFVEGGDLHDLVQASGRLALDRAVTMLEQVAHALDDAHANGLVHRDVKPSNILLDHGVTDFCYLGDFGITRAAATSTSSNSLTRTGALLGSLAYMAPEQFDGAMTKRSDVYSLTCVFFEMITGHRPYAGEGLPALMHSHLDIPPPRPSASNPAAAIFDELVATGMAKDATSRYATAGEL